MSVAERPAARKGAPLLGAAERTVLREHRSAIPITGRAGPAAYASIPAGERLGQQMSSLGPETGGPWREERDKGALIAVPRKPAALLHKLSISGKNELLRMAKAQTRAS